MAVKRIIQLGDPMLRAVSKKVEPAESAREVIRDLEDTLADFRLRHGFGRGISAIQIGIPQRVIFCQVDGVRYELINPEFSFLSEERFSLWDDCFSFPGLMVWLSRHRRIRLRHQALDGKWLEIDAEGGLAELLQHEMDHLDGVLSVDHARGHHSLMTRDEWVRTKGIPPSTEAG